VLALLFAAVKGIGGALVDIFAGKGLMKIIQIGPFSGSFLVLLGHGDTLRSAGICFMHKLHKKFLLL